MAKTGKKETNKRRQEMVDKFASRRADLKAIIMDESVPRDERFKAQLKLAKLPRNSSATRVRNRCEITGRPRGYYRKLKMCRNQLRELASNGRIPGMVKSSW